MGLTVTLTLSITLTLTLILTLTHPAPYLQDGSKYNCAYYAKKGICGKYGNRYANEGLTENVACCDCGGGVKSIQARRELKFDHIVSESPYVFMVMRLFGAY